jgi:hypothetical protein
VEANRPVVPLVRHPDNPPTDSAARLLRGEALIAGLPNSWLLSLRRTNGPSLSSSSMHSRIDDRSRHRSEGPRSCPASVASLIYPLQEEPIGSSRTLFPFQQKPRAENAAEPEPCAPVAGDAVPGHGPAGGFAASPTGGILRGPLEDSLSVASLLRPRRRPRGLSLRRHELRMGWSGRGGRGGGLWSNATGWFRRLAKLVARQPLLR